MKEIRNLFGRLLSASYRDRPIFVVGASRSGTSVLLQALGRHPKILSAPGEAPFLTSIGGAVFSFEFSDNLEYYNHSLVCAKPYLFAQLKRLALETATGEHYGLKTWVKTCLSRRTLLRPRYWAAKTFPSQRGADSLRQLYPEAQFVYIFRNGLEVVRSMTKFDGFRDQEFAQNCRAWAYSMEKYGYLLDYPAALAFRHEDLRNDACGLFERLFGFLDLPMDAGVVDFVQNTVVHPLDKRTQEHADAREEFARRRPPYEAWSDDQKAQFIDLCQEAMGRAGYDIPFAA